MARRYYVNKSPLVTLSGAISNSATTISVTSTSGFPATTPFTICIERSTANEEICLVTAVSASPAQFTVTRGWDGTTAVTHSSGVAVEHTTAAADYNEASSHVNDASTDVHAQYMLKSLLAAKGSLVSASGASTPSVLAVGTDDYLLMAASGQTTGLKWGQIVTASITNNAITFAKLDVSTQQLLVRNAATSAVRIALSTADGNIAYQEDIDRWYGYQNGSWKTVPFGIGKVTYGTGSAPTTDVQDGDVYLQYV